MKLFLYYYITPVDCSPNVELVMAQNIHFSMSSMARSSRTVLVRG